MQCFLEPAIIVGQGEYNLNVVKEIEVTDSFLSLKEEVRGCQNKEEYLECTTKALKESFIESCGCLPFEIRLSEKVVQCC